MEVICEYDAILNEGLVFGLVSEGFWNQPSRKILQEAVLWCPLNASRP